MGTRKRRQLPYLTQSRHGIYKYRRPVPVSLQMSCGLGREFIRSLGTRDPREAKRLWAFVNSEFERHLDQNGNADCDGYGKPLRSQSFGSAQLSQRSANAVYEPLTPPDMPYKFADATKDYLAEKNIDPEDRTRSATRNNFLLVERVTKRLIVQLGEDKSFLDIWPAAGFMDTELRCL